MILMNDFKSEPEALKQGQREAVQRVIGSGWYVLGSEVENFEKAWADQIGVKSVVGVANGMDALELGLRSLGIGPGDQVITTPLTAFATILAILKVGAKPVFADIEPGSALLDLESVGRCITNKTKAIILVHLYGQIKNMDKFLDLCRNSGIYLIEDCAQSHLAKFKSNYAGSFGKIGAFSFYPTKNLGALGDAGALVTNDGLLTDHVRCLRNYGQDKRYSHPELGMNSRLDELQAAILSERLGWLEAFTTRRQEIANLYFEEISNQAITLLSRPAEKENHVYHLFVLNCEKRDDLSSFLHSQGIQTHIHYPIPAYEQKSCEDYMLDPNGMSVTEHHCSSCLSIPCHPQMNDQQVEQVINSINSYS